MTFSEENAAVARYYETIWHNLAVMRRRKAAALFLGLPDRPALHDVSDAMDDLKRNVPLVYGRYAHWHILTPWQDRALALHHQRAVIWWLTAKCALALLDCYVGKVLAGSVDRAEAWSARICREIEARGALRLMRADRTTTRAERRRLDYLVATGMDPVVAANLVNTEAQQRKV